MHRVPSPSSSDSSSGSSSETPPMGSRIINTGREWVQFTPSPPQIPSESFSVIAYLKVSLVEIDRVIQMIRLNNSADLDGHGFGLAIETAFSMIPNDDSESILAAIEAHIGSGVVVTVMMALREAEIPYNPASTYPEEQESPRNDTEVSRPRSLLSHLNTYDPFTASSYESEPVRESSPYREIRADGQPINWISLLGMVRMYNKLYCLERTTEPRPQGWGHWLWDIRSYFIGDPRPLQAVMALSPSRNLRIRMSNGYPRPEVSAQSLGTRSEVFLPRDRHPGPEESEADLQNIEGEALLCLQYLDDISNHMRQADSLFDEVLALDLWDSAHMRLYMNSELTHFLEIHASQMTQRREVQSLMFGIGSRIRGYQTPADTDNDMTFRAVLAGQGRPQVSVRSEYYTEGAWGFR